MKPSSLLLFPLLTLMTATTAFSTHERVLDHTKKEISACLQSIQEGAQTVDADAVFEFVLENDNGAIVENGRLLMTREDALQNTKNGFRGVKTVEYKINEEHISLLSDDVALAVSTGSSHVLLYDGRTFNTPFAQSVILKRVDGNWKVFHAHRSIPSTR